MIGTGKQLALGCYQPSPEVSIVYKYKGISYINNCGSSDETSLLTDMGEAYKNENKINDNIVLSQSCL